MHPICLLLNCHCCLSLPGPLCPRRRILGSHVPFVQYSVFHVRESIFPTKELCSAARVLGSWVRIPLSVCTGSRSWKSGLQSHNNNNNNTNSGSQSREHRPRACSKNNAYQTFVDGGGAVASTQFPISHWYNIQEPFVNCFISDEI
jgi:hypothetical protein